MKNKMNKYLLIAYEIESYEYSSSKLKIEVENSLDKIMIKYKEYFGKNFDEIYVYKINSDFEVEEEIERAIEKTKEEYYDEVHKKQKALEEENLKRKEEKEYKNYLELKKKYENNNSN